MKLVNKKTDNRNFIDIILPYWKSEEKFKGLSLLISTVILSLGEVWLLVQLNQFTRDIYNALENKSYNGFIKQIYVFISLVVIFVIIYTSKTFFVGYLQFSWRKWLTIYFIKKWTKNHVYYQAMITKNNLDNPDQRLSQDLRFVSSLSIDLLLTFILEIVSLFVFCGILWNISNNFNITILGTNYPINGYLVFIALIYSILGTFLGIKIGKPLINLEFLNEKYEANFRSSLIRLQEKSEEISLCNGIEKEQEYLQKSFTSIKDNFYNILIRSIYLNLYKSFYINLDQLIPLFSISPMYFSGVITLGVVMQVISAFSRVMHSLAIIVNQFPDIASWKASITRLVEFEISIDQYENQHKNSNIIIKKQGEKILLDKVSIFTPDGVCILRNISLKFLKGKKYLIIGNSGIGKSTLVKVLAGIWKYGNGSIFLPKENIEYFSQKSYMPILSLKEGIFYPFKVDKTQEQELLVLLKKFQLSHLQALLEEKKDFSKVLSLGEQQRLSMIRAILHKPRWLILDEPTTSLNLELQELIFEELIKKLKNTTIITISHNEELLKKYHSEVYNLNVWKA